MARCGPALTQLQAAHDSFPARKPHRLSAVLQAAFRVGSFRQPSCERTADEETTALPQPFRGLQSAPAGSAASPVLRCACECLGSLTSYEHASSWHVPQAVHGSTRNCSKQGCIYTCSECCVTQRHWKRVLGAVPAHVPTHTGMTHAAREGCKPSSTAVAVAHRKIGFFPEVRAI